MPMAAGRLNRQPASMVYQFMAEREAQSST